jgi:DNA-binding PucR family transcriptional regulator
VEDEIRRLAKMLGGQPLIVQASPNQFWAWIGLKQESSTAGLKNVLKAALDPTLCIAIGDPVPDLAGWRRTHQEAAAAFPVALHRPGSVVRYAEVSVLASIPGNPLLQQSLRTQFLDPLACERDGGRQLLATLRTYFAHDRNGRATAAALGVHPQTITNHLQRVEQCLGRSIAACGIGLEAAVLLADLTS